MICCSVPTRMFVALPLSVWSVSLVGDGDQIMLHISRSSIDSAADRLELLGRWRPATSASPSGVSWMPIQPARSYLATRFAERLRVLEPAEEDRRAAAAAAAGTETATVEVGELAVVLEVSFCPDALADLDRLAHVRVPRGKMCVALAAANSSGIQPAPRPTLSRPPERWSIVATPRRRRRGSGRACP